MSVLERRSLVYALVSQFGTSTHYSFYRCRGKMGSSSFTTLQRIWYRCNIEDNATMKPAEIESNIYSYRRKKSGSISGPMDLLCPVSTEVNRGFPIFRYDSVRGESMEFKRNKKSQPKGVFR